MIGNATVTRIRMDPGGIDVYGDPVDSDADEEALAGCGVAPRSTSDIDDRGRQGVIVGLSLYTPYGADVLYTDQFRVEGLGSLDGTYEVDGEAGQWKSPLSSWEAGTEIALKRAQG